MNANLLAHLDSFAWEDLSIDRSKAIDDLALALDCCQNHGDLVYGNNRYYTAVMGWGDLYLVISFDQAERNLYCPWLTPAHQKTLVRLLTRGASPQNSDDLTALRTEFPAANNAWIGIAPRDQPHYVSTEPNWKQLHQAYVDSIYATIDKTNRYFKRFYVPSLKISANVINYMIRRGQTNPMFLRLDTPAVISDDLTLHGEQIQMHFRDAERSALNLNGTWKHGKFELSNEVKALLIEWGFIVPD